MLNAALHTFFIREYGLGVLPNHIDFKILSLSEEKHQNEFHY